MGGEKGEMMPLESEPGVFLTLSSKQKRIENIASSRYRKAPDTQEINKISNPADTTGVTRLKRANKR